MKVDASVTRVKSSLFMATGLVLCKCTDRPAVDSCVEFKKPNQLVSARKNCVYGILPQTVQEKDRLFMRGMSFLALHESNTKPVRKNDSSTWDD